MTPKTILVTGSSSGIGWAAVEGLPKLGYKVIAAVRTQEQVLEMKSRGIYAVCIDNDQKDSIHSGWNEALGLAGPEGIAGVFANAGYGMAGALSDITWDAMEAQFRCNVLGTHELVRMAVEHMANRPEGGRVVICSSVLGIVGMRNRGAYVASKFSLEALADVWRLELRGSNVYVSLLQPGPVLTNFRQNSLKAFLRYVDASLSKHQSGNQELVRKLSTPGPVAPFTAMPQGVVPLLHHAYSCGRPKARYQWTVQTRVFSVLKRLLPSRILDAIAVKG